VNHLKSAWSRAPGREKAAVHYIKVAFHDRT
jgi:hypothetical protein